MRVYRRNVTFCRGGQYMGAWDYGVFDDDTAYDALDDLKDDMSTNNFNPYNILYGKIF